MIMIVSPGSEENRSAQTMPIFQVRNIPFEQAFEFRQQFYDLKEWLSDKWDVHAIHRGYFSSNELAGIIRILPPIDGKLSVNDYEPAFPTKESDIQVGRVLAAPKYRRSKIILFAFHDLQGAVFGSNHRIIVTPRTGIDICAERFKRFGFRLYKRDVLTSQGVRRNIFIKEP